MMPKSMLVLKVRDTDGLGIDEIRRRLVSERHLDKQLEFTTNTKNKARAEAVIVELSRRGLLPACPGFTPRSATPISRPGTRDTVSQKASKRLRPVELAVSSDTRATVLAPCPARCSSVKSTTKS